MGEIKNLERNEAFEKLKSLTENKSCFLSTYENAYSLSTRPMMTQSLEDNGTLWFFTGRDSEKVRNLKTNDSIELHYTDTSKNSFLFVKGKGTVKRDAAMIKKLWSDFAKAWFEGPDDPNLTLIEVKPSDAYYWDTKHGKIVSNLKIVFSAVTGAKMDDGREGAIEV